MKKTLLIASSMLMSFSLTSACQAKTKTETESIAFVTIKKTDQPKRTMLSFAYTPGAYGYRMEEYYEQSKVETRYYHKTPFFTTEAGKRKLMYRCNEIEAIANAAIRNLLNKAMCAAQKDAENQPDNGWSTWCYKNGVITLTSSQPLAKERKSSDCDTDQEVDNASSDMESVD